MGILYNSKMSHFLKSWSWTHSVVSCYLYTTIFALALPCQRSAISQRPTNNYVPTGESSLMKKQRLLSASTCSVKIPFSLPNTMDGHRVWPHRLAAVIITWLVHISPLAFLQRLPLGMAMDGRWITLYAQLRSG